VKRNEKGQRGHQISHYLPEESVEAWPQREEVLRPTDPAA
jgi:hypothetical protein